MKNAEAARRVSVCRFRLRFWKQCGILPTVIQRNCLPLNVTLGKGTLRVIPNPATSMVTLQAPITMTNVKIFTIDGQLVKEFDADDTKVRFNVSDLNAGVYIIHAAETTTRLIKK